MEPRDEKTEAERDGAADAAPPGASVDNQKAPEQAPPPPAVAGRGGAGKGGGKPGKVQGAQHARHAEAPPPAVAGRREAEPRRPSRAGLVDLVALETVAAHGMPHFKGERFSATHEVAERLLRRKLAERA